MASILLALIYLAFISLGLGNNDSMMGSAWPVMQAEMGVPLSYAGILTLIIAASTILSTLTSDRMTKRFGTSAVTVAGISLTAAALFGFSLSDSFLSLCFLALPYGIGAGAIDAALNNYIALYYSSRQMNWLHCFWGFGAAIGPYIMGYNLTSGYGWNGGYRTVALIQIAVVAALFASLPLWKRQKAALTGKTRLYKPMKLGKIVKIKGVKLVISAFFAYCALEGTAGLWATSYLVRQRGVAEETAAAYGSFFFLGITAGRFLSGFFANKIGNRNMVRLGITLAALGIAAIGVPIEANWLCQSGLVLTGIGCGPVFPSLIHATPDNFGKENSQAIVGVQMASAYTGATLMPPLFGFIANNASIGLYPLYLIIMAALMLLMTEKLNKTVSNSP